MKYKVILSNSFKKDIKRLKKQNKPLKLLYETIELLASLEILPIRYKDHWLTGEYAGFRECHIAPDWLLIYAIDKGELILTALRTGSHSDLF